MCYDVQYLQRTILSLQREVLRYETSWRTSEDKLKESDMALGKVSTELDLSNEEATRLRTDLKELQGKARRSDELVKSMEAERARLTWSLEEAERRVEAARCDVLKEKTSASCLEVDKRDAERRVAELILKSAELETRVARLEAAKVSAEERAVRAEEHAARTKKEIVEVRRRSEECVKAYLDSEDFRLEMAENAADGYDQGFEKCRARVRALYPDLDFGALTSAESSDEEDEALLEVIEIKAVPAEVAPTEAIPAEVVSAEGNLSEEGTVMVEGADLPTSGAPMLVRESALPAEVQGNMLSVELPLALVGEKDGALAQGGA